MFNSVSHSELKFLFDENVDKRLERFLVQQGVDVASKSKKLSDNKLAEFSKSEQRVLVTNDEDFTEFTKEEIFSVVWLRIPQRKISSSIREFSKLIKETGLQKFKGNLIILYEDKSETSPLFESLTK